MIGITVGTEDEYNIDQYVKKIMEDPDMIREIQRTILLYIRDDFNGIILACIKPEVVSILQEIMTNLFGQLDFASDSELKTEILQSIMVAKDQISSKIVSAFIDSAEDTAKSCARDVVAVVMADTIDVMKANLGQKWVAP